MKSDKSGKKRNLKEVREAKESERKSRKVVVDEARKAKTPSDLHLAVAEMVHNRKPYHVIAEELRVSPKTISSVAKMIDGGTIKIGENGKAVYNKDSELIETGSLPKQLQMELLGASHLEGKSPEDVIAGLIRLDRKMRLKGFKLDQLESAAEFIEKAFSRGWTIDPLLDVLTRLEDSGFSDLNVQSMGALREFLECAKNRNLNPEHIIRVSLRTEEEWRKKIQEAYNLGYHHGIEHYTAWLVKLIAETYKYEDYGFQERLCGVLDTAEQRAMEEAPA